LELHYLVLFPYLPLQFSSFFLLSGTFSLPKLRIDTRLEVLEDPSSHSR
jgi:hypothetical protein